MNIGYNFTESFSQHPERSPTKQLHTKHTEAAQIGCAFFRVTQIARRGDDCEERMTSKDNIIYNTITVVVFIGIVVCSLLFHNPGQSTNGDSDRGFMTEIISPIVIAAAAVVTAVATIVLAVITSRYVRLTDSLLKATYKPEIVVYLRLYRKPNTSITVYGIDICVENVGPGVARQVMFGGDVCYKIGRYSRLNSANFIRNGIDTLAPGQKKEHNLILIAWHGDRYENTAPHRPLFPSRNGRGEKKKMTLRAGHNLLKKAFGKAGLNGHLATHSLRKSFAQRLYDRTGDIFAVQEMLGHKSVATTQRYLGVNYAGVQDALEKIAVSGDLPTN